MTFLERWNDFFAAINMIPKRNGIDSRFDQSHKLSRHQTGTVGSVFRVHHQGIDLVLLAYRRGMLDDAGIARFANQIAKKENTHRIDS